MVIAVIGILKTGAAYVPIDPAYPPSQIAAIIEDVDARVLLTASISSGLLVGVRADALVIKLDKDREWMTEAYPAENPAIRIQPESLAYVIYTSGSTGRPKGVQLPVKALVNLLLWQQSTAVPVADRHILQFASLNFDVSFQEIFFALCFGATLYLLEEEERKDMAMLLLHIRQRNITDLFIPYVVLKSLAECAGESGEYPGSLRQIITAGEQVKLTEDIRMLIENSGAKLINQYGPSEAHVVSSYEIRASDYKTRPLPPIGKPVSNTQLYILDADQSLCGTGVIGELYIGGVQVARGYLKQPDLTKDRFVEVRIGNTPAIRLYRTGDKVRWLDDGNIEYIGRIDDQVKIRGYRVELGEIETVAMQSGLVEQAVVVTREEGLSGTKRLIGYAVPKEGFSRELLTNHLRQRLPEYKIPLFWIELKKIPVNNNGKVDKRSLPLPDVSLFGTEYLAPGDPLEEKLARVWQELLGLEQVGIRHNFFELGGHSLFTFRMMTMVNKQLDTPISVKDIFQFPTIEQLAVYIRGLEHTRSAMPGQPEEIIVNGRPLRCRPLPRYDLGGREGFAISRTQLYWVNDQDLGYKEKLFGLIKRKITGAIDLPAFRRAVRQLLVRHESLRSYFLRRDDNYFMCIHPADDPMFGLDYRDLTDGVPDQQTLNSLLDFEGQVFDPERGPLFLVRLVRVGPDQWFLALKLHHAIFDGWSVDVLVRDILVLYISAVTGGTPQLPSLRFQYKDHMHFMNEYYAVNDEADRRFWLSRFDRLPDELQLPGVRENNGVMRSRTGRTIIFSLAGKNSVLNGLAGKHGTSLFVVLQALLQLYLVKLTGRRDIIIATEVFGRDLIAGSENQIGFYAVMKLVRTVFEHGDTVSEAIERSRQSNEEMSRHVAFSLMEATEELLGAGVSVFDTACKITLGYMDLNGFLPGGGAEEQDTSWMPVIGLPEVEEKTGDETTGCDLNIRFINKKDELDLHVLYDAAAYDETAVRGIIEGFIAFVGNQ